MIARDQAGLLWLFRGHGDGTLDPTPTQIGNGWNVFDTIIAPGDFNSDGYPDLIARKPDGTLWLYLGTGAGALVTPSAPFNSGWQIFDLLIAPGDFDEDGHPDILARKPDGTLWLYRGNGVGDFFSSGTQIDSRWDAFLDVITVGDFNGDGHADVLARKADGTLWLYEGLGDGTFLQNGGKQVDSGWNVFDAVVGVW